MRWAVALQEALLEQPWPDTVLSWEQAAEVPSAGRRPLWRGLRVRIGIAWGGATYRKPLNTGGPLPQTYTFTPLPPAPHDSNNFIWSSAQAVVQLLRQTANEIVRVCFVLVY